jgi:hydrogenase maturation protease
MRTLLIAIGNTLRRDDGGAHRALELLGGGRAVMQLTPEIASEIGTFDRVLFLDADAEPGEPRIERVNAKPAGSFTHQVTPATLVHLAEHLYGFRGEAFLCRIPGMDFGIGEGLSPEAEANVEKAVRIATAWLDR